MAHPGRFIRKGGSIAALWISILSGPTAGMAMACPEPLTAAEAAAQLADARSYVTVLQGGDFSSVYAVEPGGEIRCGEYRINPACRPLKAADKTGAIAEALEQVYGAQLELADAIGGSSTRAAPAGHGKVSCPT